MGRLRQWDMKGWPAVTKSTAGNGFSLMLAQHYPSSVTRQLFSWNTLQKKYSWREPDGFIIIDIWGFKSIWETVCTFQKMKGCGTWQLWNAMLVAVRFLCNQKLFLLLQLRVTICTSEYNFKNIVRAPCTIGVHVSKLEVEFCTGV